MHKRIIPAIALGLLGLGGAAHAEKPKTPPQAGKPSVSLDIKLVASNASGPTYPLQASTASPSSEYKLIGGGCTGADASQGPYNTVIVSSRPAPPR